MGYQFIELSLDPDHGQNFNFTNTSRNLKFLAQQILSQQNIERSLELVLDPENKAFEILTEQDPIPEHDEEFRNAFKGLELGDAILSIKCELIDDIRSTSFTPSEVNRNPLETMKRLLEFCQEVSTKVRRI